MKFAPALVLAALLAAGCASIDGRGLAPGRSTAKEGETLMGAPAEKIAVAGGDTLWYYPRQPAGRQTWAVRLGADGVVRSVDPLLEEKNIARLAAGSTTKAGAREILGPPWQTSRLDRMQRDVWTYTMTNSAQWDYFLYVQFSDDGIVREVMMMKDYVKESGDALP